MFDGQLNPRNPIAFVHRGYLVTVFEDAGQGYRHLIQHPDPHCNAEISDVFAVPEAAIADARYWIDDVLADLADAISADQ